MSRNPSLFEPLIRATKSSRNPPCSKTLYFHNTDLNRHILSLGYQNHVIQKSKIIYTSRNTTFIKDVRSNKIVLKVKI